MIWCLLLLLNPFAYAVGSNLIRQSCSESNFFVPAQNDPLQGEVFSTSVKSSTLKDPSFLSYYAQTSFFITGEHRPYKLGVFTGVEPETSFGNGGFGALELAARYSHLDLDDDVINAGKLSDITFGINWYLNSHSRIMLNYVRSDLVDVGVANILGMRLQVDF